MFILGLLLGSFVAIVIMSLMLCASYNNENRNSNKECMFELEILPEGNKKKIENKE